MDELHSFDKPSSKKYKYFIFIILSHTILVKSLHNVTEYNPIISLMPFRPLQLVPKTLDFALVEDLQQQQQLFDNN